MSVDVGPSKDSFPVVSTTYLQALLIDSSLYGVVLIRYFYLLPRNTSSEVPKGPFRRSLLRAVICGRIGRLHIKRY